MTKLICYVDNEQKGGWANIEMASGDYCWVEVSPRKILVKHSKASFFGVKMYEQRDNRKAMQVAQLFSDSLPNITPDEIRHPVLKPVINAVLHCRNLAEVTRFLNTACP